MERRPCAGVMSAAVGLYYCKSYIESLLLILISFCLFNAHSSAADISNSSLSFNLPNLGMFAGGEGNISKFPDRGYVDLTGMASDSAREESVGRLYYPDPLPLWSSLTNESASFNCSFKFQIAGQTPDQTQHGDGVAFVLINPASPDVLNTSAGSWLGLFNSRTNNTPVGVIAVEFDSFKNNYTNDPNSNHIGIDVNSINSVVYETDPGFTLASSDLIFAWVDYSSSRALLEVYVTNQSGTKPTLATLSYSINLTHYLPELVLIGFSASTGYANFADHHRLYSWNFSSSPIGIAQPVPGDHKGLFIRLGIGIGILVLAIFIVLLYCYWKWPRVVELGRTLWRPQQARLFEWPNEQLGNISAMRGVPASIATEPRTFGYRELMKATGNFGEASLLGKGGFGAVYKGMLPEDRCEVAVKRMFQQKSTQPEAFDKEFVAEVNIIRSIRHKNLVQLKGCCADNGNRLLVYEYLPNRSLDCHLFSDQSSSSTRQLDWKKRYEIMVGLGCALEYLHAGTTRPILHRDIKASNVMLDNNFEAKLGDFGLARQLAEGKAWHTITDKQAIKGTRGYIAPELFGTWQATTESDVYSYGAVLLEVACGRRPNDPNLPAPFQERLRDWVWNRHLNDRLMDACDSRLGRTLDDEALVRTILNVGLACSHWDPAERPSIQSALWALRSLSPLPLKLAEHDRHPPPSLDSLFATSATHPPSGDSFSPSARNYIDLGEAPLLRKDA